MAAIAIAAIALGGCGGGGEESSAVSSQAPPVGSAETTIDPQSPASGPRPEPERRPRQSEEPKLAPTPKPRDGRAPKPTVDLANAPTQRAPLPNQGTKAVAPRVPTEKGGDNSIQSYGLEADSSERIEAAAIVQAYLSAQAEGNWAGACALLSAKISANLQALARRAQGQEGGGCGPAMELLLGKAPKGALATLAQIEVLSLRVQGDNGFLIYRDGKGAATELLLARAGGGWRVDALAGNALG